MNLGVTDQWELNPPMSKQVRELYVLIVPQIYIQPPGTCLEVMISPEIVGFRTLRSFQKE